MNSSPFPQNSFFLLILRILWRQLKCALLTSSINYSMGLDIFLLFYSSFRGTISCNANSHCAVIHCCITNHPNFHGLKHQEYITYINSMDWSNCFLLPWCHLGVWVSLFQNDFIMAGKWCWLSARSLTLLVMWLLGLSHSMGTEFPDGIFQAAQLDVEDFWKPSLWSYKATLESEEELKSLLIKVKEESEQPGLKLNIQKTNVMASGPITSWQIDGEKGEQWKSLLCWAPKITADGDCSNEIKRHLLLGKKVMTTLEGIIKSRDITLLTKINTVRAMVFPVVMYGCESWTIKQADH